MTQNHDSGPTGNVQGRRSFAKGMAWTVPTVAAAAAAPAYAISGIKYTKTISGSGTQGQVLSFTLPRNAHDITYTITGGGGGSYPGTFDGMAGSGAKITGTIKLNKCGTNQTIWMIAGGGGNQPTTGGSSTQATGYGNGGAAYNIALPAGVNGYWAYQSSYGGGGGAGSAIIVGGTSAANGTPLVVVGGGGGDGVWGNSTSSVPNNTPVPVIEPTSNTLGAGGTAPGGNGGDIVTRYAPGTVTATGGLGASGAIGGAAGDGSSTITAYKYKQSATGNAGGAHGSGAYGGGNGGDYVTRMRQQAYTYSNGANVTHWLGIVSGGGGGGWAGGGSGGISIVDSASLASSGSYRYGIAGVGGPGGAGTSYAAPSVGCVTHTVTAQGSAGNAGSNATGTGAGGPGTVTITYYA